MTSPGEQAAVLLCGGSFFVFLFYLAGRRPVISVCFFFIIFTLAWRMTATMFIDLQGPVYSSQLERTIGPGTATVVHSIAYFVTLAPFFYLFRQSAVEAWCADARQDTPQPGEITLADLTFLASLVLLGFLYFDLVRRGTIPFFSKVERFNYAGGIVHRWLLRYGNLLTFWWGMMFTAEHLRRRRVDRRMLILLGLLGLYAFLTGNRFSAYYSYLSYFVAPWAAVVALHVTRQNKPFAWIGRSLASNKSRLAASGFAIMLGGVVLYAIYNNLANVRGYQRSEIWHQAFERTLIQPSEVGWDSFERIFERGHAAPPVVFRFLFEEPIDPNRNTSIQYLMFASIGEPRASDQIRGGFQFAGGFPEIFFELFGPYFAWPFLLGAGCIAAALSATIVRGMLRCDFASTFLASYVLFGFHVMYIGGMLNFVAVPSYWIKIGLFAFALLLEGTMARHGLQLVPFSLLRVSRPFLRLRRTRQAGNQD
jgi:hypothetical protein